MTSLTRDGVAWTYNRVVSGTTSTMTVTDALAHQVVVVGDLTKDRVTSYRDQLLHTTSYAYDSSARLTLMTAPENNSTAYHYDARGNVDTVTNTGKSGSPPPTIVTTASYPATCVNPASCNKPDWTRDAKGNQTDYVYTAGTGQTASVTAPAPSAGAIRPQTRYTYTSMGGVSVLTGISACQTTASCTGLADEQKVAIAYNALLQPTSVSKGTGNGTLTATTSLTYDSVGNTVTRDGPLAGAADTSVYHYDLDRELVGVGGPDPDGAGSLKPRAIRLTYNADGQVTVAEQGTVVDQSDPAWAAFASLQQQTTSYDVNARAVQVVATAGGTTYTLGQYSYDAIGRPDCAVTRMTAPPVASANACVHNAASDQISRTSYDAVGRVQAIVTGYDVSPRTLSAYTYTANGQVQTAADGNGNATGYAYDVFDRLSTTTFANAGSGSTTEILLYDANSNPIDRQLRNGNHILYAYDNLDRLTGKTLPTGNSNLNPSFSYDNLGRLIAASNSNSVYNTAVTFGYDALDRKVTEADGLGGAVLTKTMQYDLAGRRIRLTWPDAFFVTYDYDLAGDMIAVRENGATSGVGVLATFTYDDLGRRTGLTRGNATVASYGYDGISRLTSLTDDLPGSGWDQAIGLSYDSGSRITQKTSANDAYAFPAPATATATYPVNALNQYAPTAGGQATTYDPRGNLTQLGTQTFSYSAENELALAGTTNRFYYDAMHRLVYSTAVTARYDRDGWDLVAIYNPAGAMSRRYVFGPDPDEPLVWYEGSGTTDRRWLHADERGSITAITNSGGGALNIDSYDEYGVPASTNTGRFQYTGQAWQSELGMYYYKSRMYVPSLGRFAQTDPIGYDGGPNLYAYVGNNPVNFIDPLGLIVCAAGSFRVEIPSETPATWGGGVGQANGPHVYCFRTQGTGGNSGPHVAPGLSGGTATQKGRTPQSHNYRIRVPTLCTPSQAFNDLKDPGMSAPGSPQAKEGTTPNIQLWGNGGKNVITQIVNSKAMTITNITQQGHQFYPGSVTFQVIPEAGNTSDILVTGTGTGPNPIENDVIGLAFFGYVANSVAQVCSARAGIPMGF